MPHESLPVQNVFELLDAFAGGRRLNHFQIGGSLSVSAVTSSFALANERHLLIRMRASLMATVAGTLVNADLDLGRLVWRVRHNGRPLITGRGPAFAAAHSETVLIRAGGISSIAYVGSAATCNASLQAEIPIMEVVEGGTLEAGIALESALSAAWGFSAELTSVNITGLAKAYPRSRRR